MDLVFLGKIIDGEMDALGEVIEREIVKAGDNGYSFYKGLTCDKILCKHQEQIRANMDKPYRHNCRCRKPAPGLVGRALAEWEIDAGRSFMIGDRESDLLAARAAGIRGALSFSVL